MGCEDPNSVRILVLCFYIGKDQQVIDIFGHCQLPGQWQDQQWSVVTAVTICLPSIAARPWLLWRGSLLISCLPITTLAATNSDLLSTFGNTNNMALPFVINLG